MNSIENQICEAINIIVNKAISEAKYDKTIQATIIKCVDATIGKYQVKYQDSTFYAYSSNSDTSYSDNSVVYILVPGGDMSKDKTILGSTKKLGINYVSTIENDAAYEINGNNCVLGNETFEMCSYDNTYTKVLYHKNYTASQNSIKLNIAAVNEYIKNSSAIICGANFRTDLVQEQQYNGNYGVIFALDFLDNTNNEIVTRYYIVDVDKMTGNPYKMITSTRQYGIFDIDNKNFSEVNYISIFCKDFPNTTTGKEADIFVSNIELNGASLLSSDDINSYSLTFVTPQGTFFDETSINSDIKRLQAQVRVKGQVVDNASQDLSFYWFVEHVGITSQSQYYNKYGGQGWKCLNNYNVIGKVENSETDVVEWISATYEWQVKKEDITAKEVKYKCVVIYDGTAISKTIVIKNLTSNYNLEITSDLGTQFYFDIGFPTLTCKVNGQENKNYTYSWAVTNNAGNFQSIEDTPNENRDYTNAYNRYNTLYNNIQNEVVSEAANRNTLQQYKEALDAFDTITRVDKNVIHRLNVNTITLFSTYQCTVYYGNLYIGTTSITLYNNLQIDGAYSLVINGGSYVYKYNENGVSPASSSMDTAINIQGLSFTIYDNLGQPIDDEVARHCSIKWVVPTVNTLIKIPDSYTPVSITDETATYENLMNFNYQIADRYDVSKDNNNIQLLVDYKGTNLAAITDFSFVKEGESGTNGTEFSCKIVPNTPSGAIPPLYPTITQLSNGSWSLNYTPVNSGKWFRVQLYHNETKILDSTGTANSNEGKSVKITWSILFNKYSSTYSDSSSITVDNNGNFNFSGYRNDHPANIIKATVEYNGVVYYCTMPIYTVKISNNNYRVVLKDNTGFRYATYTADGKSPKYDNVNPFEIIVTQNIGNNVYEDVSIKTSSTYAVTYGWNYLGRVNDKFNWINNSFLGDRTVDGLQKNQKAVKPLDDYNGFCVTNALESIVYRNGIEVARIHMPVHLLLNKYGQSALNGWDGNSIKINEESGFILSPQIGAGRKERDNSFTGIVMGVVQESSEEVGLFGYNSGQRSIFLDAETGKAVFGFQGKAQIVIDPSGDTAQLRSGNYSTSLKQGLLIDLEKPEIRFGSGAFVVDSNGHLTAMGGGSIAGWNIGNTQLYKGKVGISSDNQNDNSIAFWAGSTNASSSPFRVTFGGYLTASSATIGSGSNKIYIGKNVGNSYHSAIYSGNKDSFTSTASGFYIGTDGISLGSRFSVGTDGRLTAVDGNFTGEINADSGEIGGWIIRNGRLENSSGSIAVGPNGLDYGSNFSVDANGILYANGGEFSGKITSTEGEIAGWKITTDGLKNASGTVIIDDSQLKYGSKFSVTADGKLTCVDGKFTGEVNADIGKIGGWIISSLGLEKEDGSVYVGPGGLKYGSNFSVSSDGKLTSNWGIFNNASFEEGIYLSVNGSLYNVVKMLQQGELQWANLATHTNFLGTLAIYNGGSTYSPDLALMIGQVGAIQVRRDLRVYKDLQVDGNVDITGEIKIKESYDTTTTSEANVHIGSAGRLRRVQSGSLAKWKHNIRDIENKEIDPKKLLEVIPKEFIYNEDYLDEKDSRYGKVLPGILIDDLKEKYPIAIDYDENGNPTNWNPRYIIPGLLYLIQDLYDKLGEKKGNE